MNLVAYHGTDYNAAKNILLNGFEFRPNEEHWLGNGIYLYQDYSLAKWWTTKPTNKFGSDIKKPAIVRCELEVEEDRVLNLLKLDDYIQFSSIFENEFYPDYKLKHPFHPPKWEKLRCAYCDYLRTTYELDAIIGNFNKQDQPYLPMKQNNEFDKFLLEYTEVQMCVFEKKIISNMEVECIGE